MANCALFTLEADILVVMLPNFSATYLIVLIVCILVSLAIHEFMHAFAGYKLGDDTAKEEGRLTLNPISHIDPIMTVLLPVATLLLFGAPVLAAKPVPFTPGNVRFGEFGAAIIAAAGPFINLALAFLGAILLKYFMIGAFAGEVLTIFVLLNVALFVFNILPIPPLDGSRVLYAFAPESVQQFMRQAEPFGLFIIFGLIFIADFGSFIGNLNQMVINLLP